MKFWFTLLAMLIIATSVFAQGLDDVKWSGDARYRYGLTMIEDQPNIGLSVVRFRLNADWSANEHINLRTQFATNAHNRLSNDIPVYTDNINLSWTQVYLDWHATARLHNKPHEIHVYAGRQPLPFYTTTAHFDPDLNFEGVSTTIEDDKLFARAAGFWLDETRTPESSGLVGAQAGGYFGNFMLAGAFYNYLNIRNHPTITDPTYGFGNSTNPSGYCEEFQVLDANGTYTYKSFTLGANYLHNIGADEDNYAWAVGCDGNFDLFTTSVWYSETKPDAILGAFADDENGGGTDAKSLMLAAYFTPYDNTSLGGKFFLSQFSPWCECSKYSDNRAYIDLQLSF